MGIFDEEAEKMAKEIASAEHTRAHLKAKLSQIAHNVAEDLTSYIGTHPRPQGPDIEIGVYENRITLRKKTTSDTMEIVCSGELGAFEVIMDGTNYGVTNQSNMARGVLTWLKRATSSKPL